MIDQRRLFSALLMAVFSAVAADREVAAGDYVWARTAWGSSGADRHYSSFSNGYGGFYVPRNAYGNNHDGRGRFTNPNGYIVPAQTGGYAVTPPGHVPVVVTQPIAARPTQLRQSTLPTQATNLPPTGLQNATIQTAPKPSVPAVK